MIVQQNPNISVAAPAQQLITKEMLPVATKCLQSLIEQIPKEQYPSKVEQLHKFSSQITVNSEVIPTKIAVIEILRGLKSDALEKLNTSQLSFIQDRFTLLKILQRANETTSFDKKIFIPIAQQLGSLGNFFDAIAIAEVITAKISDRDTKKQFNKKFALSLVREGYPFPGRSILNAWRIRKLCKQQRVNFIMNKPEWKKSQKPRFDYELFKR